MQTKQIHMGINTPAFIYLARHKVYPQRVANNGNLEYSRIQLEEYVSRQQFQFTSEMHKAAFFGDFNFVLGNLKNKEAFSQDINGNTPLHYAAVMGYEDIVELLMFTDEIVDYWGNNAILLAAKDKNDNVIATILEIDPRKITSTNCHDNNLLHIYFGSGVCFGMRSFPAIPISEAKLFQILNKVLSRDQLKNLLNSENVEEKIPLQIAKENMVNHLAVVLKEVLRAISTTDKEFQSLYSQQLQDSRYRSEWDGKPTLWPECNIAPNLDFSEIAIKGNLPALLKKVEIFSYWRKLNLSFCELTRSSVDVVPPFIKREYINQLDLSGNKLGGKGFIRNSLLSQLVKSLLQCEIRLDVLKLNACHLTDHDISHIRNLVGNTTIELYKNPWLSTGALSTLGNNSRVYYNEYENQTEIDLRRALLDSSHNTQLLLVLARNPGLQHLFLDQNNFGYTFWYKGIKQIAKALSINPSIKHLSLANCQLTDKDLTYLQTMLQTNLSINSINIQDNPAISMEAWQTFMSRVRQHRHIDIQYFSLEKKSERLAIQQQQLALMETHSRLDTFLTTQPQTELNLSQLPIDDSAQEKIKNLIRQQESTCASEEERNSIFKIDLRRCKTDDITVLARCLKRVKNKPIIIRFSAERHEFILASQPVLKQQRILFQDRFKQECHLSNHQDELNNRHELYDNDNRLVGHYFNGNNDFEIHLIAETTLKLSCLNTLTVQSLTIHGSEASVINNTNLNVKNDTRIYCKNFISQTQSKIVCEEMVVMSSTQIVLNGEIQTNSIQMDTQSFIVYQDAVIRSLANTTESAIITQFPSTSHGKNTAQGIH